MVLANWLHQCSSTGFHWFFWNRPKLPGTILATTVLCGCSDIDTWILHKVSWATQTFAEVSAAAKRLKKTEPHDTPFRKVVISSLRTLAAYASLTLLSISAASLFLIRPGVVSSSTSGIDLLVLALLTSCISFREIASEETFTNLNVAPSFLFNSSCLISLFCLKEYPISFARYICRLK